MENLIKRDIQEKIEKWLYDKEIIAIRGPRQVGKTTLLNQIMNLLEDKERIHFVSFEDDEIKERFEKNPKKFIEFYIGDDKKRHFFLFDEVQYIERAGKLLKLIYDEFKNIKIIITGSSSLDINEVGSYLVGRVLFFELYPFSFKEFLMTKDLKLFDYYMKNKFSFENPSKVNNLFIEPINELLHEYIKFGGYPKVVLEKNPEKKQFLLKNLFITYIEKDIVKVYGSKFKQRITDMVRRLSVLNTALLNYNDIISSSGFYFKELMELIGILQDTYIIKTIKPYHGSLTSELRKNPKLYFVDTGLRNYISGRMDYSQDELGKLMENYVLNTLAYEKINFWRTTAKAEVDFIINEKIPLEVKLTHKLTRALRSYINKYKPKFAVVTSLNISLKIIVGEHPEIIPIQIVLHT